MLYRGDGFDSGGKKLPEHREVTKLDDVSNKVDALRESYLEVEEGQTFSIQYRIIRPDQPFSDVELQMRLDGRAICGRGLLKQDPAEGEVTWFYIVEAGEKMEADLAFASMPKTDDEDQVEIRGRAVDELCSIEVTILRGSLTPSTGEPPTTEARIGMVHEKQMKIGSTIQPANIRPMAPTTIYDFSPAPRDAQICRFVWKYHTRASLDIMGIAEAGIVLPAVAAEPNHEAAGGLANPRGVKRETGLEEGQDDIVATDAKRIKLEGGKVKRKKTGMGSKATPIMVADADVSGRKKRASGTRAEAIDLALD